MGTSSTSQVDFLGHVFESHFSSAGNILLVCLDVCQHKSSLIATTLATLRCAFKSSLLFAFCIIMFLLFTLCVIPSTSFKAATAAAIEVLQRQSHLYVQ